jgi:hypothetical protein
MVEIQTVLESAHRGEGTILFRVGVGLVGFGCGGLWVVGLTCAKPDNCNSIQYNTILVQNVKLLQTFHCFLRFLFLPSADYEIVAEGLGITF